MDKMNHKVRINIDKMKVRMGPSKDSPANSEVKRGEEYTIVDKKNGFGQLKSKSGWIELKWCEDV